MKNVFVLETNKNGMYELGYVMMGSICRYATFRTREEAIQTAKEIGLTVEVGAGFVEFIAEYEVKEGTEMFEKLLIAHGEGFDTLELEVVYWTLNNLC